MRRQHSRSCLIRSSSLRHAAWASLLLLGASAAGAGEREAALSGMKFRSIGPALMSGRIGDFAVDPNRPHRLFAAVSSGGVWKSDNGGTTWKPVFDGEGSYSIGCVELDPSNTNVVWVGTGENNSQRSVSFGDGVYRSRDGGQSWDHLGLEESEHIGMIAIDPRDSDVVYVAAQGPLWRSGGHRGLYKTVDGGANWERILHISDDTGVNEVHLDPLDPDVLYASAYQRRRHVWTLINGGPESGLYKSEDGGRTFRELKSGLPSVDKGRIGMDISPADPDVLYAIVEAQMGKGGVFRSTDRGETWEKRSDYMSSSPQYYNELVCDPSDVDRFYSLDTFLHVSDDGGETLTRVPNEGRHVDDHALWIDPTDPDHLLVGCDGGVYRSHDRGENWLYCANLPITQFYRVAVDQSEPFYFIYGGTQDNNTVGGPSRTTDRGGIANADWFVTVGGDGFETQVDPTDPNIVYSQWQYGGLIRHDRRTGEIVDIKPRQRPGEAPYVFNWDSPLLISPHAPSRVYFGGRRLYRSDDRGDSWTAVSGDLTRGVNRDELLVMGRVQSVDAVSRHRSTSIYGNTVALTESPLIEGLIYVGTDDGLVHVTEDNGQTWRKIEAFPGVPTVAYVSELEASGLHPDRVYAAFDNHKMGAFTPYLLKSDDRGRTWTSIAGDLPERDVVYTVGEDHVDPQLLFVGTEFGCYVTFEGGGTWHRLKSGLPTIAVRDLEIQRRENDVVLGTFGRGFYVLDDYAPLRELTGEKLAEDAALFAVKPALRYIERARLGGRTGRGSQGAGYYTAENPPFGAVFTYHLKEKIETRQEARRAAEKKLIEAGEPVTVPSVDELRMEDDEETPQVLLTVRAPSGDVARRVKASREKGLHRVAWDLRLPSAEPTSLGGGGEVPEWARDPVGPLAPTGRYSVTLELIRDGELTALAGPVWFRVDPLDEDEPRLDDPSEVIAFHGDLQDLRRAVDGAVEVAGDAAERLRYLKKAWLDTPSATPELLAEAAALEARLRAMRTRLTGDRTLRSRSSPAPISISERIGNVVGNRWYTTESPTQTERDQFRYAGEEFETLLADLRQLVEVDLNALDAKFDAAGSPWTPGRLPTWSKD